MDLHVICCLISSVVKCIVCSFIINVWEGQASMLGVASESAKGMGIGLTGSGWVL